MWNSQKPKERCMIFDLQKASAWKRISAGLFDTIILGIVVVGLAFIFSVLFKYDSYNETLNNAYAHYEQAYGIEFEITAEQFESMSEAALQKYNAAYDALIADYDAMYAYNMVINLTLLIASLSTLLGFIILEFFVPKVFGNGQTLGKKIFGIAVIRTDGIKVNGPLMFIRTVLGKFTIETMIPVLILVMISFNSIGIVGVIILGLILLLQVILMIATHTNSMIHDVLAKTVVVDMPSQMIFDTEQDLVEYKKKVHEERVARQTY